MVVFIVGVQCFAVYFDISSATSSRLCSVQKHFLRWKNHRTQINLDQVLYRVKFPETFHSSNLPTFHTVSYCWSALKRPFWPLNSCLCSFHIQHPSFSGEKFEWIVILCFLRMGSKISHDLRHQFFDSFLEFTGTGDQWPWSLRSAGGRLASWPIASPFRTPMGTSQPIMAFRETMLLESSDARNSEVWREKIFFYLKAMVFRPYF